MHSGFAYDEAADIIGCAIGTVKSRVARGRGALRDYLENQQRTADGVRLTGDQASSAIFDELNRLAPIVT